MYNPAYIIKNNIFLEIAYIVSLTTYDYINGVIREYIYYIDRSNNMSIIDVRKHFYINCDIYFNPIYDIVLLR